MAKMTAWVSRRSQSASPRKRTSGTWLITGRSKGSSNAARSSTRAAIRCVHVGSIDVSLA